MPVQGTGEWKVQATRREIDGAEDCGREEKVGGEPAVMLNDVDIFETSTRRRASWGLLLAMMKDDDVLERSAQAHHGLSEATCRSASRTNSLIESTKAIAGTWLRLPFFPCGLLRRRRHPCPCRTLEYQSNDRLSKVASYPLEFPSSRWFGRSGFGDTTR